MRTLSMRVIQLIAVACSLSLLSLAVTASAGAQVVDRYVYSGPYPTKSFDGSDAVGAGAFGEPNNIAINQATGDVYVGGSSGFVYHLNAAGRLTAVQRHRSQHRPQPDDVWARRAQSRQLGNIDPGPDLRQGRVFAASAASFPRAPRSAPGSRSKTSATGAGSTSRRTGGSGSRTTGTAPTGTAAPASNSNEMISFGGMCGFAIDSEENFYIPGYGGRRSRKSAASGTVLDEHWGGEGQGSENLAIDRTTDTVYAARGNSVNVIDSAGKLIDTFGFAEGAEIISGPRQRRRHRGQRDHPRGLCG